MEDEDPRAFYTGLPDKRQGRPVRDAKPRQAAWFFGFLLLGLLLAFTGHAIVGSVFLLLAVFGAFPFGRGVGYELPGLWLKGGSTKRRGNQVFTDEPDSPAVFHLEVDEFVAFVGTVHDTVKNTDTAYIRVDGMQSANADTAEQFAGRQRLADALKTSLAQTEYSVDYGFIVGDRPFNPMEWSMHTSKHYLHPSVTAALGLPGQNSRELGYKLQDWQNEVRQVGTAQTLAKAQLADTEKVWQDIARNGVDSFRLIYVTVKRPIGWKNITNSPENFTPEQFKRSPLGRTLIALQEGLVSSGFPKPRVLSYSEVRHLVYRSWNVESNEDLARMRKPMHPKQGTIDWPTQRIEASTTCLRTDDCYHAILVIKKFARPRTLPSGMLWLLTNHPQWTWVSMNAQTTGQGFERFWLRQKRGWNTAGRHQRNALQEQQDLDVERRNREAIDMLYASGSKAIRFNVFLVISASSLADLELRLETEQSKLRKEGISWQQVAGRQTLLDTFLTATLGVRS